MGTNSLNEDEIRARLLKDGKIFLPEIGTVKIVAIPGGPVFSARAGKMINTQPKIEVSVVPTQTFTDAFLKQHPPITE